MLLVCVVGVQNRPTSAEEDGLTGVVQTTELWPDLTCFALVLLLLGFPLS